MKVLQYFTRICVENMDEALKFYENLLGEKCANRFLYAEMNLEISRVGSFLIISGSGKDLLPFRATGATLVVDSVSEFRDYLLTNKGKIVRDIKKVPTGYNCTIQNSDGTVIEYVQFWK
jgi:predicted enzyme related to lactoylglutathione lyase